MREVYLKIATRALVLAALANELGKTLWVEPAEAVLKGSFEQRHYRLLILAGLHLLVIIGFYKSISVLLLWAFNRFRAVRRIVDPLFDVEGSYLESVFINDELEVVGINHIAFQDGELTVRSELRWPHETGDGAIKLTVVAATSSEKELCTASSDELRYVFKDSYTTNATFDKTGYTKLALHRHRNPGRWTRLFRRSPIVKYWGSFTAHENEIRGRIDGRRLEDDELRDAVGADDGPRTDLLIREVRRILADGTRLRKEQPGVVV